MNSAKMISSSFTTLVIIDKERERYRSNDPRHRYRVHHRLFSPSTHQRYTGIIKSGEQLSLAHPTGRSTTHKGRESAEGPFKTLERSETRHLLKRSAASTTTTTDNLPSLSRTHQGRWCNPTTSHKWIKSVLNIVTLLIMDVMICSASCGQEARAIPASDLPDV